MTDPTPTPPPAPRRERFPTIPGTCHPNTRDGWAALAANCERYTREMCIRILAWNDPNGVYTDEACRREGYAPLSLYDARDLLADVARRV